MTSLILIFLQELRVARMRLTLVALGQTRLRVQGGFVRSTFGVQGR